MTPAPTAGPGGNSSTRVLKLQQVVLSDRTMATKKVAFGTTSRARKRRRTFTRSLCQKTDRLVTCSSSNSARLMKTGHRPGSEPTMPVALF